MTGKLHVYAALWGVPGLVLQLFGIAEGVILASLAGTALLVIGLMYFISARGYHPIWALWGIVPVMGPILLLLQGRQPGVSPRETIDTMLLEEDPHNRPIMRQEQVGVSGGWPLLAVMAPIGVLIILFSARLPHAVAPARDAAAPTAVSVQPSEPSSPAAPTEPKPGEGPPKAATTPPPPEAEAAPPSSAPAPTTASAKTGESAKPAQQESPYVARFRKLQKGMTYDQVVEIIGNDSVLVSGTLGGDKVIKWENPDKSFFAARFHNNVLERTTNLNFPPPRKELRDMTAELSRPGEKEPLKEKPVQVADGAAAHETPESQEEDQYSEPAPAEEQMPEEGLAPGEGEDVAAKGAAEEPETAAKSAPEEETQEANPAEQTATQEKRTGRTRKAELPRYSRNLPRGPHEVYFHNDNPFPIRLGLRDGKRGTNLALPPHGLSIAHLSNGSYDMYYLNANSPKEIQKAGSIVIDSPPNAIHIQIR